jgi:predicted nuclease of predicted toxin-antitoxin system
MKLLLDANLSWRLVRLLKSEFKEIAHTTDCGFKEEAPDKDIWNYARKNGYAIVSNDEDFFRVALDKGFPPKIVMLRTGNQSTKYIAQILTKHKSEIAEFMQHEEYGILEIF